MKVVYNILLFLLCIACTPKSEQQAHTTDPVPLKDSTIIVIAITPTMESFPFFYAKENGLFDVEGLKVDLHISRSQFDADTALLGTTAQGAITDLTRVLYYASQGKNSQITTLLGGSWKLMINKELKEKNIQQLKGKTIAIDRFSASDTYCNSLLSSAHLQREDISLPQINEYAMRTIMLNNNQVNAAVLPEPYATYAHLLGEQKLATCGNGKQAIGCLAFNEQYMNDSAHIHLVRKILRVYNKAITELSSKDANAQRTFIEKICQLPATVADSLPKFSYFEATLPDAQHFRLAIHSLKSQNIPMDGINPKTLLNYQTLPQ